MNFLDEPVIRMVVAFVAGAPARRLLPLSRRFVPEPVRQFPIDFAEFAAVQLVIKRRPSASSSRSFYSVVVGPSRSLSQSPPSPSPSLSPSSSPHLISHHRRNYNCRRFRRRGRLRRRRPRHEFECRLFYFAWFSLEVFLSHSSAKRFPSRLPRHRPPHSSSHRRRRRAGVTRC